MDYIFVSFFSLFIIIILSFFFFFFLLINLWKLGLSVTNTRTSDLYM
jgi:hypothetical protein